MMRSVSVFMFLQVCLTFHPLPVFSQAAPAPGQVTQGLMVFLDCQSFYCDFDHVRREIPFVNWMRDRQDADVHVLGTSQTTGGGGRETTLAFIGLGGFEARIDTLVYITSNTDTESERRDVLVQHLKLGLVPYLSGMPVARLLRITYEAPSAAQPTVQPHDPWNLWVFRARVSSSLNGESDSRYFSGNGTLTANRTAEDLKLNFSLSGRYSRSETDIPELDTTYVNTQERYSFSGLAVWSLGERLGAGIQASAVRNNYVNQDLALRAGPAIEYNIYPYSESTRRQLTLLYRLGVAAFDYTEVTVLGETSEMRPIHNAAISAEFQQPWGSINASFQVSQFLHDLKQHRLDLSGGFSVRVFRGLDFDVFGMASRIKDQMYLSGAGMTPEERLLRMRQFETDFYYYTRIGFSYRFGSKFANIVNPRMGGSGGMFIMF